MQIRNKANITLPAQLKRDGVVQGIMLNPGINTFRKGDTLVNNSNPQVSVVDTKTATAKVVNIEAPVQNISSAVKKNNTSNEDSGADTTNTNSKKDRN